MGLILNQVAQLHHVNTAHGHRLVKRLAGAAIVKGCLSPRRQGNPFLLGNLLCRCHHLFVT